MQKKYKEILSEIKCFFPQPVSDKRHDAYFVQCVAHALDKLDDFKSEIPILASPQEVNYLKALKRKLKNDPASVEEAISRIVDFAKGQTVWGHPNSQVNVIPPTTIPSIVSKLVASIYNPNLLWDEYSHKFAQAEVEVVGILSSLIGFNTKKSGGLFTFGGTGTILYGVKIGLEKACPGTMEQGLKEEAIVLASDTSHYTKLNVLGWLGMGTDSLITVKTESDNDMDLFDLEEKASRAIKQGKKIACIIATMGTTDAFGVDDLKKIVEVRDRLVKKFKLNYTPHVHADAVIGWAWSVFDDYDFENNPLEFSKRTLRSILDTRNKIQHLKLADSIGIDFHKIGYSPYVSSLLLVKNKENFNLLSRSLSKMPYLYQFGEYHPGVFTLECSRAADGALSALANLNLLGKVGYQVILGHIVEMAEKLREKLETLGNIHVLNDYNYGPVTLFRVYPKGIDAKSMYDKELNSEKSLKSLKIYDAYNRKIFNRIHRKAMKGKSVALSLTDRYRDTNYADPHPISAIKSFIISPFTDEKAIDTVVKEICLETEKPLKKKKSRRPAKKQVIMITQEIPDASEKKLIPISQLKRNILVSKSIREQIETSPAAEKPGSESAPKVN